MRTMILTCAFFALVAFAKADGLTAEEQKCFDAINAFRAQNKLPPVEFDATVYNGAKSWSQTMRRTRSFNHGRSGGAECIAMGNADGLRTFTQWKNSSGHRAILVSRSYTHAAVAQDGNYWTYRAVRQTPKKVVESTVVKTVTKLKDEPVCKNGTCSTGTCSGVSRTTMSTRRYVPLQPVRNGLRFLFR